MNFRWQAPESFHWIWLVVFIFILVIWSAVRGRRKLQKIFASKIFGVLVASQSSGKRKLKWALQILALVLALVALARPQFGESAQKIRSQGIEIIIALDVSNSMLAEDMKPSRLEQARNEINRLLDQLSGDKVGLLAFAGSSVLVSPLTSDYSSLRSFLETTSPISVSTQGTNFKSAIDQALAAMKRGGIDPDEGARVTKVLLFVTDGEETSGDALAAAREALGAGVRIFVLGMGTKAGAPIPERDDFGNLAGYKKDRGGKTVLSTANEDRLGNLAREGGGAYYHSDFSGQAIQSLKRDLSRMDKAEFENQEMVNFDERFQVPLGLAILLLLVEFLLGERRNTSSAWKGRFEISSVLPFVLLLSVQGGTASAASVCSVFQNRKALSAMEKQNWLEANREIADALVEEPESAELLYNLAQTFEANKEVGKALQAYVKAATLAQDMELQFQARFNAARLLGEAQKIPEAIDLYQSALLIHPESIEVKTNIELLLRSKDQNGGGGSNGENQQKKDGEGDKKDEKDGEGEKKPEPKPENEPPKKPQPKPFKSQELSQQEVKNILDELRRQEEQVRAKFNDKRTRETPVEKDW